MGYEPHVKQGDTLRVSVHSSLAAALFPFATVLYDNGMVDTVTIPEFETQTDRLVVNTPGGMFRRDGRIIDAGVHYQVVAGVPLKRGRVFVNMNTQRGERNLATLFCGYVSSRVNLILGTFTEPGPGGGEGWLRWEQVFHNRAGNAAAVDYALAATNALRKVYGVAWYYHADGNAATRTQGALYVSGIGGTKPTGFTLTGTNALFWASGNNALIVNEEGSILSYATEGKDGLSVVVDNGTSTIASGATAPTPWPLWVTESDTDTIIRFPAITNGLAGDTHSAYVLMEEWLVL